MSEATQVLHFWFHELEREQWWLKDEALDQEIDRRFGGLYRAACRGELFNWRREGATGRLAEILVLDQFSRHIHRDRPAAFAADPQALILSQEAVAAGADQALASAEERNFLYMPHMHSESLRIQEAGLPLFERNDLAESYDFAIQHRDIIARFGRFPHRNAILGRSSTPEELEFLKQPGSSF